MWTSTVLQSCPQSCSSREAQWPLCTAAETYPQLLSFHEWKSKQLKLKWFHLCMESASHLICLVSFLGFSKILWLILCFHKGAMWRWKWPAQHLLSSIRLQFSNTLLRPQAAPRAVSTFLLTFQSLGPHRKGRGSGAPVKESLSSPKQTVVDTGYRKGISEQCGFSAAIWELFHSAFSREFWPFQLSSKTLGYTNLKNYLD